MSRNTASQKDLPSTLKIVTVWLLLGMLVFLSVQAWRSHEQRTRFSVSGGAVEIRRSPDGHYHWPGSVNGIEVDFLVDTGATSTALPQALAARAQLVREGSVTSSTAAGLVQGSVSHANIKLESGVQVRRLRVTVLPGLNAPLLGMDVLSKLHWNQNAGVLRIEPRE